MKKLMILLMVFALTACGSNSIQKGSNSTPKDDKTLVVYSPNSQAMIDALIPMFEKETGIQVKLISAGTGELIKRIETEKDNPYADVMFGGSKAQALGYPDLFANYVSTNNNDMMPGHQNVGGFLTPYVADGSCILVNADLIGDIKIEGYQDLLNPKLKGKIIGADPASSSSAFAQLTNMLKAMGGDYTSDKGWNYVSELVKNMEGKVASSSGAVHKGVADGEYTVGITYEDPSANYVRDGAPVKIVYPKEGTVYLDAGVEIIKNAKHMENAKILVDFLTSKEAQDTMGMKLTNRPLRKDVQLGSYMTPLDKIKTITEDENYVKDHRDQILEKYKAIYTSAQG
jgi:iron(III) transport system substrate-binding protein